jgi:arylformamidase
MPPKIYDISVDISIGMHTHPGDPKFRSRQIADFEDEKYRLYKISLGNHTGTHVDAPAHFVKDGATVTELPLEMLNGRVRVVQIHNKKKVDFAELSKLVLVDDFRILFKTRNSLLWGSKKTFQRKHVYLTLEASKYLVENGIKLIGFDYLSVEEFGNTEYPVHRYLLGNQVILIEGLNLSEVEEGDYEMSCLPLKLKGFDGAPARVILRR